MTPLIYGICIWKARLDYITAVDANLYLVSSTITWHYRPCLEMVWKLTFSPWARPDRNTIQPGGAV